MAVSSFSFCWGAAASKGADLEMAAEILPFEHRCVLPRGTVEPDIDPVCINWCPRGTRYMRTRLLVTR